MGEAHRTHTFAQIAAITLNDLRKQIDVSKGKTAYHSCVSCIEKYFSDELTRALYSQKHAYELMYLSAGMHVRTIVMTIETLQLFGRRTKASEQQHSRWEACLEIRKPLLNL